jgi:endonuclease/exonuclease/phosphatase family metal-dependent hydrolase
MTRILTYNILVGGTHRVDQLTALIGSTQADIVGLAEATDPQVVEEIAQRLGMQFRLSGRGKSRHDWQLAVLSRLPIVHTQVHTHPEIFNRRHLLEVCVEEPGGQRLTVFVIHQISNFHRGLESARKRRGEVQETLRIMASHAGTPHLLMGDFNSVAPGDTFKGSKLIRYFLSRQSQATRQKLAIKARNRRQPMIFRHALLVKIIRMVAHSKLLSPLLDIMAVIIGQGGIDLLLKAGYVDCFRRIHPHEPGPTFHSSVPSGRIDFIFASPDLAERLLTCEVVTEGNGVCGSESSDHLPVYAEFS